MGELERLRAEYMSCVKLAHETDSKRETVILKKEAGEALDKLRELCSHELTVCLRSSYAGSYCEDYSDRHSEERTCLMCGEHEFEPFKELSAKPFRRFEDNAPGAVKNPMSVLLSEAKEAAEAGYTYFEGRARGL